MNTKFSVKTTDQPNESLKDNLSRNPLRHNRGGGAMEQPSQKSLSFFSVLNRIKTEIKQITIFANDGSLILTSIMCWLECFFLFGYKQSETTFQKLLVSVKKTYDEAATFAIENGEGSWYKYFKYKSAAFFAFWQDQNLPAVPAGVRLDHPSILFGGPLYNFTRKMARGDRRMSFLMTILQSKKGMARMGLDQIKKAEETAFDKMTTPKPRVEQVILPCYSEPVINKTSCNRRFVPEKTITKDYVKTYLYYRARALMKSYGLFDLTSYTEPVLPSTSSNYNNTRSEFGTLGLFHEEGLLSELTDEKLPGTATKVAVKKLVSEHYGDKGKFEESLHDLLADRDNPDYVIGYEVDSTNFKKEYRSLFYTCLKKALTEEPLVKPVGLPEPLKVRVITKGPPYTYFVLKPLQKLLWKQLKKQPGFQLIGEPVTQETIRKTFQGVSEDATFLSGDYSAATDELNSWVSEAIVDGISDQIQLPDQLRTLFKRALTGHIYVNEKGEKRSQERGQLMGSIVSFPVLSIANACLLELAAMETYHGMNPQHFRYQINGDDCAVSYTDPTYYSNWSRIGSLMGLSESLGKTYNSKDFVMINSRQFERTSDPYGRFTLVKFIHMGLIKGLKRTGLPGDDKKCSVELGPSHHELMSLCPEDVVSETNRSFFYYNFDTLKSSGVPWYLPHYLGGLGLEKSEKYNFSERKLSALLKVSGLVKQIPTIPTDKSPIDCFKIQKKIINDNYPLWSQERNWRELSRKRDAPRSDTAVCLALVSLKTRLDQLIIEKAKEDTRKSFLNKYFRLKKSKDSKALKEFNKKEHVQKKDKRFKRQPSYKERSMKWLVQCRRIHKKALMFQCSGTVIDSNIIHEQKLSVIPIHALQVQ